MTGAGWPDRPYVRFLVHYDLRSRDLTPDQREELDLLKASPAGLLLALGEEIYHASQMGIPPAWRDLPYDEYRAALVIHSEVEKWKAEQMESRG